MGEAEIHRAETASYCWITLFSNIIRRLAANGLRITRSVSCTCTSPALRSQALLIPNTNATSTSREIGTLHKFAYELVICESTQRTVGTDYA